MDLRAAQGLVKTACDWMTTDLGRCLNLEPGPNFVVALALSEYTEILGGFVSGNLYADKKSASNYRRFLGCMGSYYADLDDKIDMYKNVRCGLAHEYFVKGKSTIAWRKGSSSQRGVYLDGQRVIFVCQAYFEDWRAACEQYLRDIETDQALQENLSRVVNGLISRVNSRPIIRIP